jgi:hypothetical protein
VAATDILRLRRASGCLSTSRDSSSTTSPRARSSSTTSPTLRVRLLRHVARPVADYFAYTAHPVASARRAARRAARRRLLRLGRVFECLGTSRGSSRGSSSTTSPTPLVRVPQHVARLISPLVIDYFAYAVCPGASERRAARRAAHRRLLHLHRASGCFGTSRRSSSTTSPTSRVRVPRNVARLVSRLVIDYFAYVARPGALARRAARFAARRRLCNIPSFDLHSNVGFQKQTWIELECS